jgi:galactokinase
LSGGLNFSQVFERDPEVLAAAPGRVNLIGEHTDYNAGYVLPTAIPQRTNVELARRTDDVVRVASTDVENARVSQFQLGSERRSGGWLDYVAGCTDELRRNGFAVSGFDALITSRVPVGAGVSSSAALEVALLRALRAAFELPLDDVALARTAHQAEFRFVGARVGVMDQMAASLADTKTSLFLDTRSLAWERIALPAGMELVVIDSGVAHDHAHGGYNLRREQCERAAELLGVETLRGVADASAASVSALPSPLAARVRHVVTENARVLAAVAALRDGDVAELGRLFYASHESLRDDYEVSAPELDLLVELARARAEVYGARMTGGGFGGSVVVITRAGTGGDVAKHVAAAYAERTGRAATILVP